MLARRPPKHRFRHESGTSDAMGARAAMSMAASSNTRLINKQQLAAPYRIAQPVRRKDDHAAAHA
jgi:hypothetical protein